MRSIGGGLVVEGVGVLDRGPGVVVDGGDGGLDFGVQAHGDRHIGAAADRCGHARMAVERRIRPHQRLAGGLGRWRSRATVARVSPIIRAAPRGEPHAPLRSR